jgi:hypothetical protein
MSIRAINNIIIIAGAIPLPGGKTIKDNLCFGRQMLDENSSNRMTT